jgi:rod shape-determining protein MreD
MKPAAVLLTVLVSVILQTTLARYTVGGSWVFDLVLVGVIFAGLEWGPVAGILAGTIGGLLQDTLAGEIMGIGGLAKTVTGCVAGVIGTQFVLARPQARVLVAAGATVVHRLIVLGLHGLIDQHWPGIAWGAMLAETGLNTACALVLFVAASATPGIMERQRMGRRSSLSRRQW